MYIKICLNAVVYTGLNNKNLLVNIKYKIQKCIYEAQVLILLPLHAVPSSWESQPPALRPLLPGLHADDGASVTRGSFPIRSACEDETPRKITALESFARAIR